MRFSAIALAGVAAAAPATLSTRELQSVDISGSYWDVTLTSQTGRPGYSIRDLSVTVHNPKFDQTVAGKCHYSFVPQGTSPPAETDTCDTGLSYTWDYKTLEIKQKITVDGEILTLMGSAEIKNECNRDGSGSGSNCKATAKVDVHHYCKLDPLVGCFPIDGKLE